MANDKHLPTAQGSYRHVVQDLVQIVPGGTLRLNVISSSMAPLLRPGDAVVAEAIVPGELQCGDIVVTRRGGELITHRFIVADTQGLRTRGDNASGPDEAVAAQLIVGRGVAVERGDRIIDLRLGHWPTMNRWLGQLGLIELRLRDAGYLEKHRADRLARNRRESFIARAAGWPVRAINRAIVWLGLKLW